jgi:Gpi18-like mannosyltransferase
MRFTRSPRALLAPAIYLLNPAVVLAGPVWGQIDAAGALAFLAALLAVAAGRYPAAGALATIAMLIKPQAGLVALPVAAVALVRGRATGTFRPLGRLLVGAAVAYLVIAIPLRLDPIRFAGRVISAGALKPFASLNAPNPWGVLVGYKVPDGALFWIGAALLLVGLLVALLPLRRRQDLGTILAVGLFVVFAFYFLPTRVHERYLFPAMALAAPLAAASWRVFGVYLILSAGFTATILYALVATTPFSLPGPIEQVLITRTSVLWIGLTLLASAATLAVLLLRSPGPEATSAPRE